MLFSSTAIPLMFGIMVAAGTGEIRTIDGIVKRGTGLRMTRPPPCIPND